MRLFTVDDILSCIYLDRNGDVYRICDESNSFVVDFKDLSYIFDIRDKIKKGTENEDYVDTIYGSIDTRKIFKGDKNIISSNWFDVDRLEDFEEFIDELIKFLEGNIDTNNCTIQSLLFYLSHKKR